MGRRGGAPQKRSRTACSSCQKQLPQSAFPKAELCKGAIGLCRGCLARTQCEGCNIHFSPTSLDAARRCYQCRENEQVDRLLQTPKDEVTHFGAWHAQCLQREVEHTSLLVCYRHGLWERCVLQRVLDFLRVPFVTSNNDVQYCELCDQAFSAISVTQGQQLHMASGSSGADWCGCPDQALRFSAGERHVAAELHKAANGKWFFRTLAKSRCKRCPNDWHNVAANQMMQDVEVEERLRDAVSALLEAERLDTAGALAGVSQEYLSQVFASAGDELSAEYRAAVETLVAKAQAWSSTASASHSAPSFVSLWAPLSATVEGKQEPPLIEHLQSRRHVEMEQDIASGRVALVSRSALQLAKELGEQPTTSLSRFRAGLGNLDRFCTFDDLTTARALLRVRDSPIPVKFFREVLDERKDMQWVTVVEMEAVEDAYAPKKSCKHNKKQR